MTTYIIKVEDISVHALHTLQRDMLNYMSLVLPQNAHVIALLGLRPTFSFGNAKNNNRFKEHVERKLGPRARLETGALDPAVREKLHFEGLDDCAFIESNRGGGSTYVGPGQRTVFFNYNLHERFPGHEAERALDTHILNVMYNTVTRVLHPWTSSVGARIVTHPQKDLLAIVDEELKLASKGWAAHQVNTKKYSQFGCSFHVQEKGLVGFDTISACGFPLLKTASYEGLLGRHVPMDEFDTYLLEELSAHERILLPDDRRNIMQKNVDAYLQNPTVAQHYRS